MFADADALSPLDDDPLAAHSQARYLETAGLADASGDPALDAARSELLGAYEGLEVEEANLYTVERLDPLPEPGEAVDEANRLIEEKFAPITTGLKPDDIKI